MYGYDVVFFEVCVKVGGFNEYGIVCYKLVDDFVWCEVEFFLQIGGIELCYGQCFGDNLVFGVLYDEYDVVFFGIGLVVSKCFGLEDEDVFGLFVVIDYICELWQSDDLFDLFVVDCCIVIGVGNIVIDMVVQMSWFGVCDVNLVYCCGFEEMGVIGYEQEIVKVSQVCLLIWV